MYYKVIGLVYYNKIYLLKQLQYTTVLAHIKLRVAPWVQMTYEDLLTPIPILPNIMPFLLVATVEELLELLTSEHAASEILMVSYDIRQYTPRIYVALYIDDHYTCLKALKCYFPKINVTRLP